MPLARKAGIMSLSHRELGRARGLSDLRVLVVEDEEVMRALLARMLSRLKVERVVEAESGPDALEQIAIQPFDLIICDWNMPDMSGMEFFDSVHARDPALPFVMVTGRADAHSIVVAKRAGISAYIVKPISQRELKAKIQYVLQAAP
jgi:two-component system, chemotaxis family, chemotaxis protein CheY